MAEQANTLSTPAETLPQALSALYHHPDPAVKDQASRWIQDFQTTQEAWNVTDAALHNPASAFEVQVFCAQARAAYRGLPAAQGNLFLLKLEPT